MKSTVWLFVRLGISAGLLALLLRSISPAELAEFFGRTVDNWPWLIACLAQLMAGNLVSSLRLQCLMRAQRIPVRLMEIVKLHLISAFYNQVLPSTIGGDIFRTYWVSRAHSADTSRDSTPSDGVLIATTVIGLDRVVGAVGIIATALLAAALDPSILRAAPALSAILPSITLGVLLAAALPFVPSQRFGKWLFSIPLLNRVRTRAVTVYGALKAYRQSLGLLFSAFLLSIALQSLIILQYWFLANALQLGISLHALAVLIPVVTLISMIPITINGIGLRENALRTLGAPLGFTAGSAIALGWAFVLFKLVTALVGGVLQFGLNRSVTGHAKQVT